MAKVEKRLGSLAILYKAEWKVITGLKELRGVDQSALEDAIRPIVDKYGPMVRLRLNIGKAIQAAGNATTEVEKIRKTFGGLGVQNRKYLAGLMKTLHQHLANEDSAPSPTPMLDQIAYQLTLLRLTLLLGSGDRGSESAEPTWFHKSATFELLDQWLKLVSSAGKIPFPRMKEGHNAHSSTEFVCQCLKMIDPDITAKRARTAIQKARTAMNEWRAGKVETKNKFEGKDLTKALTEHVGELLARIKASAKTRKAAGS